MYEVINNINYQYTIHTFTEDLWNTVNYSIVYVICDDKGNKLYCGQTDSGNSRLCAHKLTLNTEGKFNNLGTGRGNNYNIKSPTVFNDNWYIMIFDCKNYTAKDRISKLEIPLHEKYVSLVSKGGYPTSFTTDNNPNVGKLPWLHMQNDSSRYNWSLMPNLYKLWLDNSCPVYSKLEVLAKENLNLNIQTRLYTMVKYFKLGKDYMNELLIKHSMENWL